MGQKPGSIDQDSVKEAEPLGYIHEEIDCKELAYVFEGEGCWLGQSEVHSAGH